jgi:hypothetical protein
MLVVFSMVFVNSTVYTFHDFLIVFLPAVIIISMFVFIYVVILQKTDFDFSDVKHRPLFLTIISCATLTSVFIGYYYYPSLFNLTIILLIINVITGIISLSWKISMHAIYFSAGVFLLVKYFGMIYISLLIFMPLIFWARLILKKHTFLQLVAGTILGMIGLLA